MKECVKINNHFTFSHKKKNINKYRYVFDHLNNKIKLYKFTYFYFILRNKITRKEINL